MPVHPLLGQMLLLSAYFGCTDEILSVCATLSCKPPFVLPLGKERQADAAKRELACSVPSDHLLYAAVVREWRRMRAPERSAFAHRYFVAPKTVEMIVKTREDLAEQLRELELLAHAVAPAPNHAVVLAVVAASMQLAVRPPAGRKFATVEASGTTTSCSVHPSSVAEHLSAHKRARHGNEHRFDVLAWFSRLKTADVYLHDVSHLPDVLPLVLLSPKLRPHPTLARVFEVVSAPTAIAAKPDAPGGDDDSADEGDAEAEPPALLILVDGEASTVELLLQLRRDLLALIDRLLGAARHRSGPSAVTDAFRAVRELLTESHARQSTDPSRAAAIELPPAREAEAGIGRRTQHGCAAADEYSYEQRRCAPPDTHQSAASGRGARKGAGRGGGGGYPWWTHLPSYRSKGKK
jgi:hypothetical protein